MGMEHDAYDDGLQAWLAGNPGWPGWPPPQATPTSLEVAVLRDRESRLHDAARALAAEAGHCVATGDAYGARRADELLTAVLQELTA
jgi:hypothetical protein